ncbi:GvpL/GvpF family gas vesicle protein [Nocardia sp. NPDC088792]|uniref:GvpL/GvpF family gas vesicle protein n=1 Tax=Nocardia sp. NPDC088792 TaxID=3364332 RepID=UPI003805AEFB
MSTANTPSEAARTPSDSKTALLIYAIVPAETRLAADGIGRVPSPVRTVTHGPIAALVSEVPAGQPLDQAEDIRGFANIVDALVTQGPIIPMRFGSALPDDKAVDESLLAPNEERFHAALGQLFGQAEYLVQAQYLEMLTTAVAEEQRHADSEILLRALSQLTGQISVRPPTHDAELADIAVLIPFDKQQELLHIVNSFAEEWQQRAQLRIVGPLAAWDFLAAEAPESTARLR